MIKRDSIQIDSIEKITQKLLAAKSQLNDINTLVSKVQQKSQQKNQKLIKKIKQKDKFKSQIDPRYHELEFDILLSINEIGKQFSNSSQLNLLKTLQQIYLQVTSYGFMNLHNKQLTKHQTKTFIAKKLFHNISKMVKSIKQYHRCSFEQIFEFIQNKSKTIIDKIMKRYPIKIQYGAQLLKNQIRTTFLKLKLNKEYYEQQIFQQYKYNQNRNYISQTMKVLNVIIQLASNALPNEKQITIFDLFSMTTGAIFSTAGCQVFQNHFVAQIKGYCRGASQSITPVLILQNLKSRTIIREYRREIKKNIKIEISKKIDNDVNLFQNQDIQNELFNILDPSLIQIMQNISISLKKQLQSFTKWTPGLRKMCKKVDGLKIQLSNLQLEQLAKVASQQLKRVDIIFQNLLCDWSNNVIKMICQQNNQKSFQKLQEGEIVKKSSQAAVIFTRYLFTYINQLIHSLLILPINAKKMLQNIVQASPKQKQDIGNLYLVSFKINDIMKARLRADEDHLIQVFHLLSNLTKQSPQFIKLISFEDRIKTQKNDFLLTLLFINKYLVQFQLQINQNQQQKQYNYNFMHQLLYQLKNCQFGIIAECIRITAQGDPKIFHSEALNILNSKLIQYKQKILKKSQGIRKQKIQFATLNYSGILLSPFQFYSKNGIQKETKICNQFNKILERSKYFNNREIKWEVGDIDKKMQIQRYTPIYRKNAGIENQKLLTKNQFIQKWNQQFDKNLPRIKKLNFKESQKQCIRFFDTLCYETFVTFVYKIESIENQQQMDKLDINQYKEFMRQFYERSFIDEQRKVKTTLESINSQKLDIMFIQQSSELLKSKLAQQPTKYKVISHPQGESMILLMESLIKLKWEDESEMQMKNNFTQQEINGFNINNDTVIMWINKYILICTHLSSKKDKNQLQSKELLNLIKKFKTIFPNHIIILGCDANTNKLGIQGNGFDIFPTKQDSFTTCKKRTVLQLQYHKANQLAKQKRDYLITNKQIFSPQITTINNIDINNMEYQMPTEDHPFDHYLVKASIVNIA